MTEDYRLSHLSSGKGESYHATFQTSPYRNMVWEAEKGILDDIISTRFRGTEIHHLDFACGTGRIIRYLSDRTATAVGVDISPSMLEVARRDSPQLEFIEADLTVSDVLEHRKFNLITAFRFFANAQPELRIRAMQVLNRHLADDGYIVFNNHKNTGCTRNRLARLMGRRGYRGMSIDEVEQLLKEHGLEVAALYPLSVFPASEKHPLLPIALLRPLDRLLSKCAFLQRFGENLIFVSQRSRKDECTP